MPAEASFSERDSKTAWAFREFPKPQGSVASELNETPKVFLDPHYLQSVVYNLLTNALESVGQTEAG